MDIQVSDAGHLTLDAEGNLALVTGAAAIRQRIITHLRLWRGEWFLDTAAGVPYYTRVLEQPLEVATASVATAVRRIPGVRNIRNLSVAQAPETRQVVLRMTVDTDAGTLTITLPVG